MFINQILAKLKSSVYSKSETDSLLNGKASSSHTHTKSQITDFPTIPTDTNQLTNGAGFITSSGSCSYANSAGSATTAATVYATADEGGSKELIHGEMTGWDSCWIRCGGSSDAGYLEIATADNGNEPIYVKQYNYDGYVARTLTLLNGSGNTEFPGTVYVPTSIVNWSDSRLKNSVTDIDDALLDAWENIEPKQYKFNDATEEKGDKARYHTGYLAQDIQAECEKQGVNASDYGLFCYDEWDEQEEISEEIEKEKDGKIVKEKRIIRPKREKGDRYSLRYAEALVVECKYLRRENSRLKENLASIEERLEKLEKAENS